MRTALLQTSFGAGELAPELLMRRETSQYRDGAQSLRNNRLLVAGGAKRRPGSWWAASVPGPAILVEFTVDEDTKYILAFSSGRMDAFMKVGTGSDSLPAAGNLTSAPWTGTIWREMQWVQNANTVILVHPDMPPQVVTRTGASTWARTALTFYAGAGGRTQQPYYKVASPTITLAPSALTGSVTLTASGAHFVAGHVGQKFRYAKRELTISAVTDSTHATATVVEALPPTRSLTVASSAGFAVGQAVEGADTGVKGIVTAVPDGTHVEVVLTNNVTDFGSSESLVGPFAASDISATAAASAPAAVTDWDEALFNAVNGYPGAIAIHRNRLMFGGHATVPNALIGSKIDNFYDFDVGTAGDGDAIFELIGDDAAATIVQLHSSEQLLVLTDKGPYYCPESVANPFRPTSIAFFPFGDPWPCARAPVGKFDGGVVMVSGSLVIKLRPTGDLQRSWVADEVSLLSPHLLDSPVDTAFTSNFAGGPERYAVFANADGTAAVMMLVEAQEIRNFVPWDTNGTYLSFAALGSDLYALVSRTIDGTTTYCVELFDQDLTLDAAETFTDLEDVAASDYGDTDLSVVCQTTIYLGALDDALALDDLPDGPYTVGMEFTREIVPMPPHVEAQNGKAVPDVKRLTEIGVNVLESARFALNGRELQAYLVSEDPTVAPPLRTGWKRFKVLGWSEDPTWTLTQPDPLPLTVLGVSTKVAF